MLPCSKSSTLSNNPLFNNIPVVKYYSPEEFKEFEEIGIKKGFDFVESGPLVRSSFHAEKHVAGH